VIRGVGVYLAKIALLAAVYVAGAKAAFALAFVHTSIAPVWLPSGIALAGVLLLGVRAVPGVWLGAFLFNASTPVPLWVSGAIAAGNTLEAVAGTWLLRRAGFRWALDRVRDVLALGLLAAPVATVVSACVGVGCLWAAGIVPRQQVGSSWVLWWSGDAVGVLTITPLLLLGWSTRRRPVERARVVEAACLAVTVLLLVGAGLAVRVPGPFLAFPALVWAAIRFHQPGADSVSLFIASAVAWATSHGYGPFVEQSLAGSLLLTQSMVAVLMASSLLFAALTVERERATQALRQASAEVQQRNRELERERAQVGEARVAAERANQAKSEFLSRMSHELRTPLNAILGFAQLLELEELSPEQRDSLNQILAAARHLVVLVNEVLDIAAIQADRLPLCLEPVPVADVAAEAVSLIRPLADRHGVAFTAPASSGDEHALGDRRRLKQILLNLLTNAVKYNHADGDVRLACTRVAGDRLRIEVADSGPGIAPETCAQLFVPFERLGVQQTGLEGAGLGLPLSRSLAEAMGGTLELASTSGQGSVFWLELPRVEDPATWRDAAPDASPAVRGARA
jgi:signal transduction histidine kinase